MKKEVRKFREMPLAKKIIFATFLTSTILSAVYLRLARHTIERGISWRIEHGKPLHAEAYAQTYTWYSMWGLLAISLIGLIFFNKIYLLQKLKTLNSKQDFKRSYLLAIFLSVVVSVAISSYFQFPRLNHSLWGDEEYSMRHFIVGEFKKDENSATGLKFFPADWFDVFWNYITPNNHIYYSALAKISHGLVGLQTDKRQPYFSEFMLRLPAILFSLISLLAVAIFFKNLGLHFSACFAPFFLAFHPWFNHYGSEARGYSLVFFLIILSFILIDRIINRRSWRYILAFAVCQHAIFSTFPGALYLIIILNLGTYALIFFSGEDRLPLAVRFSLGNALSLVLTVFVMLPNFTRLLKYLARDRAKGEITNSWFADVLSRLSFGTAWKPWDSGNPNCYYLQEYFTKNQTIFGLAIFIFILLAVTGAYFCYKRRGIFGLIFASVILPLPITILQSKLKGNFLYEWYAFYLLAPLAVLLSLGFNFIMTSMLSSLKSRNLNFKIPIVALLSAFIILILMLPGLRENNLQRTYATEDLLGAVKVTRNFINPISADLSDVITVGFIHVDKSYDPSVNLVKSAGELKALMDLSGEKKIPLFVNLANYDLGFVTHPDIMALLENERYFKKVAEILGLQSQCTRVVMKCKNSP